MGCQNDSTEVVPREVYSGPTMNSSKYDINQSNVFQACNDEYKRGVSLNREILANAFPDLDAYQNDWELVPEVIKNSKDHPEFFHSRGSTIPPDEILDRYNNTDVAIPMRHREDFKSSEAKLPSSDLLTTIHYYTSQRVEKLGKKSKIRVQRNFDETALLGLGALVESLAEKLVGDIGTEIFIEKDEAAGKEEESETDSDTDSNEEGESGDESAQNSDDDSIGSLSDASI